MNDTLLPLPIYPYPLQKNDMDTIKAAKSELNVDFKVLPRPAVPGSPVRVLALREKPYWLCDYALVMAPEAPGSILSALKWVLLGGDDNRATTLLRGLQELMPGTVEIPWSREDELELTTGVRFE